MGLRTKAIDHIFSRMAATYGAAWDRSLGAAPLSDIKAVWAEELSGFDTKEGLEYIAWAFSNLPEKCPNLIEFKNLCRKAPAPTVPMIAAPPADPERLKAELSKLGEIAQRPANHHKDWARSIVNRHNAGEKVRPISLQFAREALRSEG